MTLRRTLAFVALALVAYAGMNRPLVAKGGFGLEAGAVNLKSAGPLAFGPSGILFVADPLAATVYAIDTGDRKGEPDAVAMDIDNIDAKLAGMLAPAMKLMPRISRCTAKTSFAASASRSLASAVLASPAR